MGTCLQARKGFSLYDVGRTELADSFIEEAPIVPWEVKESTEQRNAFLDKVNEGLNPH
jgi:hypothetical protein